MKSLSIALLLLFAVPAFAADTIPPDPPASMQTEYVPNFVTMTWAASPSPDVALYRVYKIPGCDLLPECGPYVVTTRVPTDELTFTGPFGERGFGGWATYFVAAVDTAGNESPGVGQSLVGVDAVQPELLVFASPAPNPSRGDVAFSWTMPQAAPTRLTIVDLAGRTVRLVASGTRAAGPQRVTWDGRDARGQTVRPGAYFARLESPWGSRSRMLVRVP
jgi:hypothetical protein